MEMTKRELVAAYVEMMRGVEDRSRLWSRKALGVEMDEAVAALVEISHDVARAIQILGAIETAPDNYVLGGER